MTKIRGPIWPTHKRRRANRDRQVEQRLAELQRDAINAEGVDIPQTRF